MAGPEADCPGCKQPLRATSLSGVAVQVCPQCKGTLLAQIDMIRTLEAMSVELLKTLDPDVHLEPVPNVRRAVACPGCGAPMSRDNYCGAGIVHFDRCERCHLLWLGADELGTMTLMWARMERRLERTQRANQERLDDTDAFVSGVRAGRAAQRILASFL